MKNLLLLVLVIFCFGYQSITIAQTTFIIDPTHTFINFGVERFMVGEVTGRFNDFEGSIDFDGENVENTSIAVKIKTNSIDTGFEVRDGHLKSEIWLDAEKYPEILFNSKGFTQMDGEMTITADLTIHGVTNEVTFPVEIKGPFKDPTQSNTLAITGEVVINRQDYGISFGKMMDNGHLFIGNDVKISIRALAAEAKK